MFGSTLNGNAVLPALIFAAPTHHSTTFLNLSAPLPDAYAQPTHPHAPNSVPLPLHAFHLCFCSLGFLVVFSICFVFCWIKSPCTILILSCQWDFYIGRSLLLEDGSCSIFGKGWRVFWGPCLVLGVWVSLKSLVTVMPLTMPSFLVLIPLYAAHFLSCAQDMDDQVVYDPFEIIYGPIS